MPRGEVRHDAKLEARGKLVDSAGPVAGVPVTLVGNGKSIGRAQTGPDGTFHVIARGGQLKAGDANLALEYRSTTPWRRGANTTPITIKVLPPRLVPIGYTIGAFAATAAVVLAFVLARTRPWAPLVERWRRRRKKPEGQHAEGTADAPAEAGLKLARPSIMSSLRRPADLGLSGSVRDLVTGVGVGGARVTAAHMNLPAMEVYADPAGHFEIELRPGVWRVEVAARGYVTERFGATTPHRGELRGVRVDLLPVREKLFAMYRDVARPLLPKAELWGVWTPREIFDHVRRTRPAGQLAALTDFVEEAYFSQRIPDETILPIVAARAQAAAAELR
jgi:hypothetical protein